MRLEEFQAKLNRWATDFPEAAQRGILKAAQAVRTEAVTKHLRGRGQRSAGDGFPNDSLGMVSGDLRASIGASANRIADRIRGLVFSEGVKYAAIHEFGGDILRAGAVVGRMPERSYLRSSLHAKQEQIVNELADEIMRSYGYA